MSRHTLEFRDNSDYDIAVGWDGPTGTFFGQVITRDDRFLVDVGHAPDQIFTPGVVLDAIRPYAPISVGLDNELMREALDDIKTRDAKQPPHHPDYVAYLANGEIYGDAS